jgi:hypothetical protein
MTGDSNSTGISPSTYIEHRKRSNSKDIEITVGGLGSYENDRRCREKYDELHKECSEKYDKTYLDDKSYEEINEDFRQEAKNFFNNHEIKELCIKNEALQEELLNNFKQADSLTDLAYLTCSVLKSLLDTLTSPGLSDDIANNLYKRVERNANYVKSYTDLSKEINTNFQQAVLVFFGNNKIRTLCINNDELQEKLLNNFKQAGSLTGLIPKFIYNTTYFTLQTLLIISGFRLFLINSHILSSNSSIVS